MLDAGDVLFFLLQGFPPMSTLFPYTTLFRSHARGSSLPPGIRRSPSMTRRFWLRCFAWSRSEEHTSELQSHSDLVCRLLLEKKKKTVQVNDALSGLHTPCPKCGLNTALPDSS